MRRLLVISILLATSVYPQSLEQSARNFARDWLNTKYKKCGDYYRIVIKAPGALFWFQLTNPPSVSVDGKYIPPRVLTEADKLNGVDPQPIEWKGYIRFTYGPYRYRTMRASKMVWTEWKNPDTASFGLTRQKGKWHFRQDASNNPVRFECSNIPEDEW